MLKCHLKCDTARWDGERFLSSKMRNSTDRQRGGREGEGDRKREREGVVSWRRLNRRDMRQTVRVTDKQPWSLGPTSGEKHYLGADNKLPLCRVIAARAEAYPTENLDSLSLESANSPSAVTRDSARCVLLIWEFTTPSWLQNCLLESLVASVRATRLQVNVFPCVRRPRVLVWIIPRLRVRPPPQGHTPSSACTLSARETWCISSGFA